VVSMRQSGRRQFCRVAAARQRLPLGSSSLAFAERFQ
jgi:hypothetical protein